MEVGSLGASELVVSKVGLGCNNFGGRLDREETWAVVEAALDAGITFLDTAHSYGGGKSEEYLGSILDGRRDGVVLATKFGAKGESSGGLRKGSRENLRREFGESLERLRTDVVDLLYYHFPDGETPIAETIAAMQELVDEGAIRAIGVSNFTVAQLQEAQATAPIAALQNEYSLLHRDVEADVLPYCAENGIGFVPFFPLASGRLTGKYDRSVPPPGGTRLAEWRMVTNGETWDQVDDLARFAEERSHSLLELAIGALLSRPGVASVIAGATSAEQVRTNAAAAGWQLSADDLAALPG